METVTVTYKVYDYDELNEKAKEKVINDTIEVMLEAIPYENQSPSIQKAIDKAESMRTPWFTGSYILDYAEDEIEEWARAYGYLDNGEVFNDWNK